MSRKYGLFLIFLFQCGDETNFLDVSEEFIQNALFQNTKEIKIISPTSDSVKTKSRLSFALESCGAHLTIGIADSKLIVHEAQISNWEYAGIAIKNINLKENADKIVKALPTTFMKVETGKTLDEPFEITSGRWYWTSWSFTEGGEMECSSIQAPFFVR